MSWQDIDFVMTAWLKESDAEAWSDWLELKADLDALADNVHLFESQGFAGRFIHREIWQDLQDQILYTADELRPHLRLAAADRQASITLRM